MFKRSKSSKALKTARIDTLIGRGVTICGDIQFSAGLHIDGHVMGDVCASGDEKAFVTLGAGALIEGRVEAPNAVIGGRVVGDVVTTKHVELKANAEVTGDVHYVLLEIAAGAEVSGQLIHVDDDVMQVHPGKGAQAGG